MNMTTVPSNQLKEMQQQLAEKDAEIERLCDSVNYKHSKICELGNQLAAQELVIQQLRDALEFCSGTSYIDDAHRVADEGL